MRGKWPPAEKSFEKGERRGREKKTRKHFFRFFFFPFLFFFALMWIPTEMSGKVGQWDLKSLCSFFLLFFSPHSLLSFSLVNGKWAIRLGEGKMMSERKKQQSEEEEVEKKTRGHGWEWWFGSSHRSLTSWRRIQDKGRKIVSALWKKGLASHHLEAKI